MPVYTCDTSGNGLFYWSANPGVPTYGGTQVTSHPDGTYEVSFDHGDGTDGSPSGSTQTYMAPDYVDPGCYAAGGGVYLPLVVAAAPPPTFVRTGSADVVIAALGVSAAPLDYVLPQSAELQPLAVTATFDGSGAAGDYNPTLVILNPGGAVVSRVPTDTTITAGDDAEVTFAPFLRSRATSTPATGGDFIFAPNQNADLFGPSLGRQGDQWYGIFLDSTIGCPFGMYLNNWHYNAFGSTGNIAFGQSNGNDLYFRFALGPHGSEWRFDYGFLNGQDFGIINVQIASVPDVSLASPGVLKNYSSLTYVNNPGIPQDCYEPTATPRADETIGAWPIRIGGNVGDPLTTWIGENGNGGPGIYAVRLYVDGKNAASTSYKAGIWSFAMNRVEGDDIHDDCS